MPTTGSEAMRVGPDKSALPESGGVLGPREGSSRAPADGDDDGE